MLHTVPPRFLLAAWLICLPAWLAAGEGAAMRDLGEYTVHYNAISANELDPEMAEKHALPRTADRCVVTVAVVDKASGESVEAGIMASATRPDGRMFKLDMRPVTDAGGKYYVGELPLDSASNIEVTLEVRPEPDMLPQTIRFRRDLATR